MRELKAGLNANKFATFWMLPKNFYHSFVLQMTLYNGLNASSLTRFQKNTKTCESVKRNAELFLYFLRLLSRKQRLNQNSSTDFL